MEATTEKEIDYCDQCPHAEITKVWTPDSFDDVRKINCKMLDKIVHSYLDWHDKSKIPNECPFNITEVTS